MINSLKKLYYDMEEQATSKGVLSQGHNLVFGEGNISHPALMLVGEAPGANEELEGRPFVGKAGKNLTELLASIALKRETIFISNVVKLRPYKISKAGNLVNRPPNNEEKDFFIPYLYKEVDIVKPKSLVSLGNIALNAFIKNTKIGELHGQWQNVKIDINGKTMELKLFPLYHPAAIIYNRSLLETYKNDLEELSRAFK